MAIGKIVKFKIKRNVPTQNLGTFPLFALAT